MPFYGLDVRQVFVRLSIKQSPGIIYPGSVRGVIKRFYATQTAKASQIDNRALLCQIICTSSSKITPGAFAIFIRQISFPLSVNQVFNGNSGGGRQHNKS